jgi:hypothetical protein
LHPSTPTQILGAIEELIDFKAIDDRIEVTSVGNIMNATGLDVQAAYLVTLAYLHGGLAERRAAVNVACILDEIDALFTIDSASDIRTYFPDLDYEVGDHEKLHLILQAFEAQPSQQRYEWAKQRGVDLSGLNRVLRQTKYVSHEMERHITPLSKRPLPLRSLVVIAYARNICKREMDSMPRNYYINKYPTNEGMHVELDSNAQYIHERYTPPFVVWHKCFKSAEARSHKLIIVTQVEPEEVFQSRDYLEWFRLYDDGSYLRTRFPSSYTG